VQYIVSGVEQIGYANIDDAKVTVPYDETKDVLFVQNGCDMVTLRAGMFMILGPQDAHMPGITAVSPQPVRKVVVKVIVS
jgi:YhcH/YjgK/YiaL family protein